MITEADRIEAVRQILLQLYKLVDLGFPTTRIRRIEREAIFFLFESEGGKFPVTRPHSAEARRSRKAGGGRLSEAEITYDHAVPLATLRDGLRAASSNFEAMQAFLVRFLQGVVITRAEDQQLNAAGLRSTMPGDAASDDLSARYERVGIAFEEADAAILNRNKFKTS